MLLKVFAENPSARHIKIILESLARGEVIIYPTDTVYAIGCDMHNKKAIDKLCQVIGKKPGKADLSIICSNLSNISDYTAPFDKSIYKLMRKVLPGPYTFILKANSNVPKIFNSNKKTVGIRVPDNNLTREIVEEYGNPIVTASIKDIEDDINEYPTDPDVIIEMFKKKVNLIIDGGTGGNIPSTVVNCSNGEIEIVRQGKGELVL